MKKKLNKKQILKARERAIKKATDTWKKQAKDNMSPEEFKQFEQTGGLELHKRLAELILNYHLALTKLTKEFGIEDLKFRTAVAPVSDPAPILGPEAPVVFSNNQSGLMQ